MLLNLNRQANGHRYNLTEKLNVHLTSQILHTVRPCLTQPKESSPGYSEVGFLQQNS